METNKKVLILGAGFVSAPVVDYLTRDNKTQITVGKRSTSFSVMFAFQHNL